jgi:hypothetical protein
MAVLALAAAGAALAPAGIAFAGISYASIGWTLGSIAGQLLFPGKLPDRFGPRVGDLRVQQSQYGAPIPILYGTTRVAGNVIWSTPLIETATTTRSGGKGGPKQSQTTYSYRVSMAILLGEGPVLGVRRIWADGKLVYNIGAGADQATRFASVQLAPGITFYPGTETQQPDPTMQAYLGANNVPAYLGLAYLVLSDFQLAAYGNRRPNITVEVVATGTFSSAETYTTPPAVDGSTNYKQVATDGNILLALDAGSAFDPCRVSRSFDGAVWGVSEMLPFGGGEAFAIRWFDGVWNITATVGIYWSDDGQTWDISSSLFGLTEMAYNGVIRVAIGTSTNWAYSYNGKAWTEFPSPSAGNWVSIVWTGSVFLALRSDGVTARSSNGVSWTLGSIGFGSNWSSVATSGTTLIAVTAISPTAARSTNHGASWTSLSMPASGYTWITWGSSSFVAVRGTLTDAYARSKDGVTWQSYAQSQNVLLRYVTHRAGIFYATNQSAPPNQRIVILLFDVLTPDSVTLATVVTDISRRAGLELSEIDATELAGDSLHGYAVGTQMTARSAIEPLQRYGTFDLLESSGKIVFRKRGGSVVRVLNAEDLAARAWGDTFPDELPITRQQEVELPSIVSVVYVDSEADYQQMTQQAQRVTTLSRQQTSVEVPVAMGPDKARGIAEALMYDAWTQRQRYTFTTSRRHSDLEPADVVSVVRQGVTHLLRIEHKTEARSGIVRFEAVAEEASVYTQSATGGTGPQEQGSVEAAPPTVFVPLNAPLFRDQDDSLGFYAAARGLAGGWRGSVIYSSSTGGETYNEFGAILGESTIGHANTVLPTHGRDNIDLSNTVTVTLYGVGDTLESVTSAALLEGANFAMLGAEVIQFRDAQLVDVNRYVLSHLVRGAFGTEWATGTHAINEKFTLLNESTMGRFPAELNASRRYKPVSIGRTIQDTPHQDFTFTGVSLRPLAPVNVSGGRLANGDLVVTWNRRSRLGKGLPLFYNPPLGEQLERYDVEIWNSFYTVLIRTFSGLTTPALTYTAANQITDFGSAQALVRMRIFQVSQTLAARGYAFQGER